MNRLRTTLTILRFSSHLRFIFIFGYFKSKSKMIDRNCVSMKKQVLSYMILSSAARGSGNVVEHPLPLVTNPSSMLAHIGLAANQVEKQKKLYREIQVIGPRNIIDQIKIEVKSHLVKSGLQSERITTHFTARRVIIINIILHNFI